MMGLMGRRLAAMGCLAGLMAGCSWFRGSPEPAARLADRMRKDPVPLERLRAAAAEAPQRNVLLLKEAYLAELPLGASTEQVRRHWGEPTRIRQTAQGTWWDYEESYPKPGPTPEPEASGAPPDERREPNVARVGMNLRLLFVDAATPAPGPAALKPAPMAPAAAAAVAAAEAAIAALAPAAAAPAVTAATPAVATPAAVSLATAPPAAPAAPPVASSAAPAATPVSGEALPVAPVATPIATPLPTPTPKPKVLAHIQAWAPARFQTRSLVRVLDPAVRVERKYGKPPKVLAWGGQGGEVWLYPAANVAFVVTPLWDEQPRYVAGTLVGF